MGTSEISFGMLKHAPRMGARIGVTFEGCKVWVSTVLYARQKFTRVEADECDPCHYEGILGTHEAAKRYVEGAPCIDSNAA